MQLSNWTGYPKIDSKVYTFYNVKDLKKLFKEEKVYIPYGNGRSYSDCCLNSDIIYCRPYRYFLDFDEQQGIIHCQSGVLLSEILDLSIPKGWFLKVTPGTKYITIGGAIASDVHGKNHHIAGCFSETILEFRLLLPSGDIITCKKGDELFHATCGGMGLTGIILDAKIQLERIYSKNIKQTVIKTRNLEETLKILEEYKHIPYSVAWVDCLAKEKNLGRSLIMMGEFIKDGDLSYTNKRKVNVPFYLPSFILNKLTAKLFNEFYYRKITDDLTIQIVDIDKFFYPLDLINNWNRIYGKKGFLQYQFILPKKTSYEGLEEILATIAKYGKTPFLAVLKLYGPENNNFISFPLEGYSLALDFKLENGIFEFLNQLDKLVLKYNGRIYLAKDSRINRDVFEAGYPRVDKFREVRKKYDLTKKLQSLMSRRLEI